MPSKWVPLEASPDVSNPLLAWNQHYTDFLNVADTDYSLKSKVFNEVWVPYLESSGVAAKPALLSGLDL